MQNLTKKFVEKLSEELSDLVASKLSKKFDTKIGGQKDSNCQLMKEVMQIFGSPESQEVFELWILVCDLKSSLERDMMSQQPKKKNIQDIKKDLAKALQVELTKKLSMVTFAIPKQEFSGVDDDSFSSPSILQPFFMKEKDRNDEAVEDNDISLSDIEMDVSYTKVTSSNGTVVIPCAQGITMVSDVFIPTKVSAADVATLRPFDISTNIHVSDFENVFPMVSEPPFLVFDNVNASKFAADVSDQNKISFEAGDSMRTRRRLLSQTSGDGDTSKRSVQKRKLIFSPNPHIEFTEFFQ